MTKYPGRILPLLLTFVFALALLSGCGSKGAKSDEDLIREDLQVTVDTINNYAADLAAGLGEDEDTASMLEMAGISLDDISAAFADKMSSEIISVEVDGDTAIGTVSITMPDYSDENDFQGQFMESYLADKDLSAMSEEEAYKVVGEALLECMKSPDFPLQTEQFDVTYVKENGEWKLQDQETLQTTIDSAFGVETEAVAE